MDNGIGQVINALRKSGQYENTLIVFTSDNGGHLPSEANNGPVRDGKQSMYEGGLLVPTAITWPGKIQPGTVTDQINLSMDLYPTLLDAASASSDDTIEGRSFLPTLLGENFTEEERPLFFTRREGGTRYGGQSIYAVRLGNWKLLQNSPWQSLELYNLANDPKEQRDLAEKEPEKYQELLKLLMKHIQQGGQIPWQPPISEN